MNDLRFAIRQLTRTPGFAAVIVLTLALGIGANTSVFLLVSDFFLRPLPVRAPQDLVCVFQQSPRFSLPLDFSYPDFLDLHAAAEGAASIRDARIEGAYSGFVAFQQLPVALSGASASERVWIAAVSPNFFEMLGLQPALGRLFANGEGQGADPVVVLSDDCWRQRFAANPAIIGQRVTVNGEPFTVIGVTPSGFHGLQWTDSMSGFVPVSMLPALRPASRGVLTNREGNQFRVMARVHPGVSLDLARSVLDEKLQQIISAYPDSHEPAKVQLLPEHLSRPAPKASRFTIPVMAVLMSGAVAVFATAVANATNLLFVRAVTRERELAIRSAVGASRSQLVRQLVIESLLLALLSAGLGLLLTQWIDGGLKRLMAVVGGDIPPIAAHGTDWRVPVFTFATSLFAGLLAALVPAWMSTRRAVFPALKGATALAAATGTHPLGHLLVVAQVALSCAVLVAAALALRSAQALTRVEVGFRTDHLLLASYDLGLQRYVARYGMPRARQFHADVLQRLSELPGVRSASLAERVPFDASPSTAGEVQSEGAGTNGASVRGITLVNAVSPSFCRTLGLSVIAGRDLLPTDGAAAPRVALVTDSLARKLWPQQSAVGRRLVIDRGRPIEVVGVVRNARFLALGDSAATAIFVPIEQNFRGEATLAILTQGDPITLAGAVARVFRELDPELPLFNIRTMEQQIALSPLGSMPFRFGAMVIGLQGTLALALALTGIYGLVSFSVARRTREIGIRIALGSSKPAIVRLVAGQSLRLTLIGMVVGMPATYLAARPLARLLFGVSPGDPVAYFCVGALVVCIAIVACWTPVRRALNVNPIEALRAE